MDIVKTFGNVVSRLNEGNPEHARTLLKVGWRAMNLKYKYAPDKRLIPADRYLANMMMDKMLAPLSTPEHAAIVSIFMPCEMLQEAGLVPYNAEAFSCYISASNAERPMLELMDGEGISETFCSYHKVFNGAATSGLMPRPRCIVHTNLICDANLVSFRRLQEFYGVPLFYVDVPYSQTEESIAHVERQLRDLARFLEETTGRRIDDDALAARVERSRRTLEAYGLFQELRATRLIPSDLVTPLYSAMTNNVYLGTEEQERYVGMLLDDAMAAPPKTGLNIYWMHTIPYWSKSVQDLLMLKDGARSVGDELAEVCEPDFDPSNPYRAMARRMVYNSCNGPAARRIDAGIRHAKRVGADGVVWFNHWGCKHTIGISQLAKKRFEAAGIPLLVLDGDGCDKSHGGEGQLATRLSAFLEMLGAE